MKLKTLAILLIILALPAHATNITIASGSCPGTSDLLTTLTNLPGCIAEAIINTLASGFVYTVDQFLTASFNFIAATPTLTWFCTPYNNVMAIIESLYAIAFMALGLFYIFRSTDVEGRLAAKEWLKNIFFLMLLLSFSFKLFDILVSINSYLTTSFLASVSREVFNPSVAFGSLVFAFVILITSVFVLGLTFMTLLARYLLIPFLLLLFPIAIFLYFLPFTKQWGSAFLKMIVSIIFMSSLDALLIMALSMLFNTPDPNLASGFIKGMAIMLGFSLIGLLNVFVFLSALFTLVGAATNSLGSAKYIAAGIVGKVIL